MVVGTKGGATRWLISIILCALVVAFLVYKLVLGPRALPALKDLNVVLIVVDTLAAKHLGAYDSKLTHSPNIDALAKKGVLFKKAYSTAPWTKPAITSILTSQMPSAHKVNSLNSKMAEELESLPELLKAQGFSTKAIVSHMQVGKKYGFAQGFDDYQNLNEKGLVHKRITSDKVSDEALKWLEQYTKSEKPSNFFLFLHYFDPHYYYHHHEDFSLTSDYKGNIAAGMPIIKLRKLSEKFTPEDLKYVVGLYREEIAFTDFHIGRVLDSLKGLKLDSDTLIVFVSDHGEEFMERGWIGHTRTLYDELIKVPMIMALPGQIRPQVVNTHVSQIDIVPTIMSLAKDYPVSPKWEGVSLVPFLRGERDINVVRDLYAEVSFHSSRKVKDAYKTCVMEGDLKLVLDEPTNSYELYDRGADPDEKKDLSASLVEAKKRMAEKIKAFKESTHYSASKPKDSEVSISEEEAEQLESLGYM